MRNGTLQPLQQSLNAVHRFGNGAQLKVLNHIDDETAAENIDKAPVPRTFKLPFGIVYKRKKFVENRLRAAYPFKILFVYHSVILARNGLLVRRKKTRCLN